MINNQIPRGLNETVILGRKARKGVAEVGPDIDLFHNTVARLEPDLFDLIGNPATPEVPGKQARYAAQLVALADAHAAAREAISAGREFCRLVIGILKSVLGVGWNTQWQAAGFTKPSLALQRDPVPMLLGFREYFRRNPAREVAPIHVTAAKAELMADQIGAANAAVAKAKQMRITLKAARDAALRKLQQRLSGLRAELDQILSDDDGRWYAFGFRRPADGRMPAPVTELEVTSGGPGIVLAKWGHSSLAQSHRVSWRRVDSTDEPIEVGLFSERKAVLMDLPSGADIVVLVTARNASGETAPTKAIIAVT